MFPGMRYEWKYAGHTKTELLHLMREPQSARIGRVIIFLIFSTFACSLVAVSAFFLGQQMTGARFQPSPEGTSLPTIDVTATAEMGLEESPIPPAVESTPIPELPPAETPLAPELELLVPQATPGEPLDRESGLDEGDLDLLFEVWRLIARNYDGELPTREELIYSAINGSMGTLDDQFTRFIPPEAAERMRQDLQGSFEGIGAFIRRNEDSLLEIVRPMANHPAARAGILPGDIITHIDGVPVQGMTLDEGISRIRGPEGTVVRLTIQRAEVEESFDLEIERARIEIAIVESQMLPENIAYVRLTSFSSNSSETLQAAISELMAQNPEGMIFDLRDNPGGFLDQSVAVADIFLPEGIVLLERNLRGLDEVFNSQNGGLAEELPLIVLVNAGSASAAEIVAGAIQDRDRAPLIGETTFGKGSVQQTHTLSNGSELRVTVARWYTPNDNTIDGEGIVPDIEVLPSPIELGGPDDNQLQRAIEYLQSGQ
jgi:carboxyl-terminal processing protease